MAKELISSEFRRMVNAMTTKDEVKAAWDLLRSKWRDLERVATFEASHQYQVGDRVRFDSRKRGRAIVGTIERFNAKSVSLKDCRYEDGTTAGKWKVAPEFLRPCLFGEGRTSRMEV